ncbi:hypothetical protein I4U23_027424 [Adineta vaga]|nr:hypothetical protein I4U23_027424 [Adineta vaga]
MINDHQIFTNKFLGKSIEISDTQTIRTIDAFLQGVLERFSIPGIALGVFRNDKIIHAKGYGYSNIEHQVPVKPETVFQSGSVGKQFTSMAIMMLIEKGKLRLDDKIKQYFPDAPSTWNNITIRHLLTHTSGMTDYPDHINLQDDYTEEEIYQEIKKNPLAFPVGEQWSYSNLGYVMLGILIRRITNQFYGDFLKENVFNPLGMTTARVINETDIIPNRASGYILANGELKNQAWVSPSLNTMADGALYLTIYDMAKWDAGLNNNQLLKDPKSFDTMWSPVKLNNGSTYPYGFGWTLARAKNGMRIVEHGGAWQGFKSFVIRILEEKLTIVLFANLGETEIEELAKLVLHFYKPELVPNLILKSINR